MRIYLRKKKHYCFLCIRRKYCSFKEEYKNVVAGTCPAYKFSLRCENNDANDKR